MFLSLTVIAILIKGEGYIKLLTGTNNGLTQNIIQSIHWQEIDIAQIHIWGRHRPQRNIPKRVHREKRLNLNTTKMRYSNQNWSGVYPFLIDHMYADVRSAAENRRLLHEHHKLACFCV